MVGRVLGLALALALAFGVAAPSPALADEPKVAVLNPTGAAASGANDLGKSVEKTLAASLGPIVPDKKLRAILKKLGLPSGDPIAVGQAAWRLGAAYVVMLDVEKKGTTFTARARVIDVAQNEVRMDFRSNYRKRGEAKDRGKRLATKAIERIRVFEAESAASASEGGEEETNPDRRPVAGSKVPNQDEPVEPSEAPRREPEGPGIERRVVVTQPERDSEPEQNTERERGGEPGAGLERSPGPARIPEARSTEPEEREPTAAAPRASEPALTEPAPTSAETSTETKRASQGPLIRASAGVGTGIVRIHKISSAAVAQSKLSYSMAPVALLTADLGLTLPGSGAGVRVRGLFSPVRFGVSILDLAEAPGGSILQLAFALESRFRVLSFLGLAASAGLRFETLTVDPNSANVIVSSQTTIPYAGLEVELELNEELSFLLSTELGLTASQAQAPVDDGKLEGGFDFAVGGGVRYWFSEAMGLAVDGRYDAVTAKLSGTSGRQLPVGEALEDVTTSTKDLRLMVGLALRLF
ncbi:MAG: hypothetical protein HY791_11540 [Deltaproteobacteria bacterium]|nr:hypothetical protein [Deltaproteobacteria bacterium]